LKYIIVKGHILRVYVYIHIQCIHVYIHIHIFFVKPIRLSGIFLSFIVFLQLTPRGPYEITRGESYYYERTWRPRNEMESYNTVERVRQRREKESPFERITKMGVRSLSNLVFSPGCSCHRARHFSPPSHSCSCSSSVKLSEPKETRASER